MAISKDVSPETEVGSPKSYTRKLRASFFGPRTPDFRLSTQRFTEQLQTLNHKPCDSNEKED